MWVSFLYSYYLKLRECIRHLVIPSFSQCLHIIRKVKDKGTAPNNKILGVSKIQRPGSTPAQKEFYGK